jgi:hypothetical protein
MASGKVVEFVIKVPTLVEAIKEEPEEMKPSNIIVQRVCLYNSLVIYIMCLKIQHSTDSFQYLAVGDVVDFLLYRNLWTKDELI